MDLHVETQILGIIIRIIFDGERITIHIAIGVQRKGCQRDQVDPISLFQSIQVPIACRHPDHIGNAGQTSCRRPHPDNIMIAPLYIHRMVLFQCIHDNMGTGSSVVNVPHNMQMINYQTLNEIGKRDDEFRRPSDFDNGMDNLIVICFFVMNLRFFRDQFFNDIRKVLRQCLSYLTAGVLGRYSFRNLNQSVQRDLIPVLNIVLCLQDQFQFLPRIIDQCCKTLLILLTEGIPEFLIDFPAHGAGSVFQDVTKLFILSVYIRQKMLCSFGKIENCLQIDNLRRGCRNRRILIGQAL